MLSVLFLLCGLFGRILATNNVFEEFCLEHAKREYIMLMAVPFFLPLFGKVVFVVGQSHRNSCTCVCGTSGMRPSKVELVRTRRTPAR